MKEFSFSLPKIAITYFVAGCLILLCHSSIAAQNNTAQLSNMSAKAYLLMNATTGEIMARKNMDKRLPPASLTKMMTSYIAIDDLEKGKVGINDEVKVSIKAWKTGGSRMFIREGTKVRYGDLLQGMIVQSGNDASVAVAEYLAGSEKEFVKRMNETAKELGMTNTKFANVTGLPAKGHYSTARDLGILSRAVIRNHPNYYKLYSQKSYEYDGIKQRNRNKLLWRDPAVDGIKTGYTASAGYCIATSAMQGDKRLISVVLGARTPESRMTEAHKLLKFGYGKLEIKTKQSTVQTAQLAN